MDTCVFIEVHTCAFQEVKSETLKFQSRGFFSPSSSALSCILPGIFFPVQPDVHLTKNIKMNPTNHHRRGFNKAAFAHDLKREENTAQTLPKIMPGTLPRTN